MSRWKRALKVLVITAVSLAAFYLVAANVFLAVGLRRIVGKPSLMLGYRTAWTVWPGRVHVRDFHVQGQSDTVEWQLAADHGVVDVDVPALTHREIHLHDVHADGLRFRLRLRVMPGEVDNPQVLALPPIPPYDDPPVRLAGAVDPAILRGEYRHWVARIDDSDAQVTEIWVNHFRFAGVARSRGGFYVAPHRSISMPPATLDVSDGVLTVGDLEMARGIEGRVTCAIDSFNPDELHERAMLRAFSGDAKLDAQVPSLAFLQFYVPPSRVRFEDGGGPLHTELLLRSGLLVPGSLLQLGTDGLRLHTPAFEIRADGTLDWRVGDDTRTVAHASVSTATVWRLGLAVHPVSITDATAAYTTQDGDVAAGFAFAGLSAQAPRAVAPDLRWLTGVHDDAKVRFDAGRVTVASDLAVDASFGVRSHATATVDGAVLVVKEARLHGDLTATGQLTGADVRASRRVSLSAGSATLSHTVVTRGDGSSRLWARAEVESGELSLEHGFAMRLASHASVTGTDAILDLVGAPRLAKAAADVFGSSKATASASMAYQSGVFTLKISHGASGLTHVAGELQRTPQVTDAAFVVRADPFTLGILLEGGHVQTAPEPGDKWLDEHRPHLAPRDARAEAIR